MPLLFPGKYAGNGWTCAGPATRYIPYVLCSGETITTGETMFEDIIGWIILAIAVLVIV